MATTVYERENCVVEQYVKADRDVTAVKMTEKNAHSFSFPFSSALASRAC